MPIRSRTWSFVPGIVGGAPEDAGVYALWDENELIYYGRTPAEGSLRAALLDHLEGRRGECTRRATRYSWELSSRPAEREAQLLAEFRAEHRRLPRCNQPEA